MSRSDTAVTLKQALSTTERVGAGRGYPPALRLRAATYIAQRRSEGVTDEQIAREIGVSAMTFRRWVGARRGSFAVATVVDATPAPVAAIVVHGPCGLRVEGLSVDEVAALWSRLS
jgi:hypothetical protein